MNEELPDLSSMIEEETQPKKAEVYTSLFDENLLYCSNCGAVIEREVKYCPICKAELDWENIKPVWE